MTAADSLRAVLLAILVLATWLGCLGFVRLRAPLDRLHCVTFVNATAGLALLGATLLADGLSTRAAKTFILVAIALIAGAALSHATARAILLREAAADPDPPDPA